MKPSKIRGSTLVPKLAQVRWLVAVLGSKHNFNWWDCSFLDQTGQKFLSLIFPRSANSAALEGTTEAAQRVHDSAIIRIGTYHLFRLPTTLQQQLHLANWPHSHLISRSEAMDLLKDFADPSILAPEGPIQVGVEKKILTNDSIRELASHYHSAFSQGVRCFPYFASMDR